MSTNNISQKQIFSYLVSTLNYWGIKSMTQQTLKQAKKNNPSAIKQTKITLFYLVLLHMFDYKIKVNDYVSSIGLKEQEIDEVILAYLAECQCPLLLQMKNQKTNDEGSQSENYEGSQIEFYVGCNLQSSRNLLILCGWVMGLSDYFNQILQKVILPRLNKIQNPTMSLKAVQAFIDSKINRLSKQFPSQSSESEMQSISSFYKSIKAHMYQTECYKQKRIKLKSRVEKSLQKIFNSDVEIESLLSIGSSTQKQARQEQQLLQIIENEIENMNQRKYFWVWLEEKILKDTESEIKKNCELFQNFQQDEENIVYDCQVDLEYLGKYIELCEYYEEKYHQLKARLDQAKLTFKKSKQIESQVQYEFKQTLNKKNNSVHKKHLFIALQLKNHLNIDLEKDKKQKMKNENDEQNNDRNYKVNELSKKLRKQVKKYINSIQDAIKFI